MGDEMNPEQARAVLNKARDQLNAPLAFHTRANFKWPIFAIWNNSYYIGDISFHKDHLALGVLGTEILYANPDLITKLAKEIKNILAASALSQQAPE
jgi:hypothetical protein